MKPLTLKDKVFVLIDSATNKTIGTGTIGELHNWLVKYSIERPEDYYDVYVYTARNIKGSDKTVVCYGYANDILKYMTKITSIKKLEEAIRNDNF